MNSEREHNQQSTLEQAAAWYHRLSKPEVPEEVLINWQSWLTQAEANMKAFEEVEEFMQLSGRIEDVSWPDEHELLADDYDGQVPISNWKQHKQRPERSIPWRWMFNPGSQRPWVLAGATVSIIAVIGLGIMLTWWRINPQPGAVLNVALYETRAAEHSDVALSDGSLITVGAKSLISVAYSAEQRRIILERGEAFFDVAKDPQRPFIVSTGNSTITAVGTAFNVTRREDHVVVTVAEGTVFVAQKSGATPDSIPAGTMLMKEVSPPAARLEAGQQIAYDNREVTAVYATDPSVATAWRQGRLKYLSEKLRYVIADVNRYSQRSIRIGDEVVANLSFTGTVFQDNIDTWIVSLEEAFPVEVKEMPDGSVLLLSRTIE